MGGLALVHTLLAHRENLTISGRRALKTLLAANKRLHHCGGGVELIRGKPATSLGCHEMMFKSLCE